MVEVAKVGSAFVVNSTTVGRQDSPTITSLAGGGFAVTWVDYSGLGGDADGTSIKAQIFNAAGAPVGSELLINTRTTGDVIQPRIGSLENGGFVVTWFDYNSDFNTDIKAQIISPAGTKVGSEFQVNPETREYQYPSSVTGLTGGGFVIVWDDYNSGLGDAGGGGVRAKVYAADGVAVSGQFLVNTQTSGTQGEAAVTSLSTGGFIVSWKDSSTLGDGSGTSIKAQLFNASGAKVGSELLVNTQTAQDQFSPAVTELQDGSIVITWVESNATLGDGSGTSIKAQLFDAAGAAVGSEIVVNTSAAGNQIEPKTTSLSDGKFVVTWTDTNPAGDGSGSSVKGQAFNPDGTKLSIEFLVNTAVSADQSLSSITGLDDGTFVVTWRDGSGVGDTSDYGIKAQIFSILNAPVIDSDAGGATASVLVNENITAVTTVHATDLDPSDTVTYSISGGADQLKFHIDETTGALSFITGPDFEAKADANGDNVYDVIVTASDGTLTDTQAISVTVANVNEASPVISSNGGGATATVTMPENTTAVTKVVASDTDAGTTLTYSISGGADAAKFQIDAATGALSFKAVPSFETPTDAGGDNVYDVTVAVSDGTRIDTQDIAVTVTDVAEGAAFTSIGKLGAEVLVNTNTSGRQTSPSIAGLEGGGYVVVWCDLDSKTLGDTSSGAIKAQLYAADGSAIGSEFLVNTFTPGNQIDPTVTALDGGGFAVTWSGPSNDSFDILGQVFDASGAKVGSELTINPITPPYSNQYAPSITGLEGGGFVATWWDANSGTGGDSVDSIKAQIYAADGSKVGGEFRVNSVTAGTQYEPSIAGLAGGGFVVTWSSDEGTSGGAADLMVKAQIYSATGVKLGGEFQVNTANGGHQLKVEVTGLADGHFVVVWEDNSGVGGDTSRSGIKAQLFDADGTKIGGEILVNTFTTDYQTLPKVAALENGDFVVTWNTFNDGSASSVSAQVFHADGTKSGTEFTVNTTTSQYQHSPSVTGLADGSFAIAWYDDSASVTDFTRSSDIRVQIFGNNDAPVITSHGGGANAAVSVAENSTATITTVTATDSYAGTTFSYALSGADASKFQIDANGALSFKAGQNYEAPGDVGANRVYDVVVTVSDGTLTDSQAIAVTVTNVDENPAITSNSGGDTAAVSIAENSTAVTTVAGTDPEGATVTYAISGGADAALFDIDPSTGALRFKAAPDFETKADAGANNVYDVIVTASDAGGKADTQAIAVTVTNVNEAPVISSNGGGASASVSVAENGTAVTTVHAGDADGNTVTYSISGGADQSKFQIDAATGELSFINAPNFEAKLDANGDNVYDVIVRATDGTLSDTQSISVAVTNVNEAPVISSNGGGSSASVTIAENTTAVATVAANDVDAGTSFTYSISGGADAALFQIDASTGALRFKAGPNFEVPGDAGGNNLYDVIVTASDGNLTDTQAFAVSVTDANDTPVFTSNGGGATGSARLLEKTTAVTTVHAGDADGDTVAYSISGTDAALFQIDAATGALSFKAAPSYLAPADAGGNNVYDVIVSASDGSLVGSQALAITVDPIYNYILGTILTNSLTGTGANDGIYGKAGNDRLNGLVGNDLLDGGFGNDTMSGGQGDDLYFVDSRTDKVIENAGEGTDTVHTTVAKSVLGKNVENLTFTTDTAHTGMGNELANHIIGGGGNDLIDGKAGADALEGGAGNDTYQIDNVGDTIVEGAGAGTDSVFATVSFTLSANVENLTLKKGIAINATGNASDNVLTGNANNNVILGNDGADTLIGGSGNDTLTGGIGADTFVFDRKASLLANIDTITDFVSGSDHLAFSKSIFKGFAATGDINAGAFWSGAGTTTAHDADDRFIYNTTNGSLWYDADGSGKARAVQVATLTAHPTLDFSDILIVA